MMKSQSMRKRCPARISYYVIEVEDGDGPPEQTVAKTEQMKFSSLLEIYNFTTNI